jgi:hypothetical protein
VSSAEIINHVNTTLYNILRESLKSLGQEIKITFGSPADEDGSGDTTARLLVFLYNIIEDPFSRNRPDDYRGGNRLLSFKPPLSVNLYYMLTPFSDPSFSTDEIARISVQAHNMIALAMRAFHDNAMVSPRYFPRDTTLGESQIRISSVQMNLEEITKIWSSFNKPFKLSVCYEVSIVRIQSEEAPKEAHVVEKAALSAGLGGGSDIESGIVPAIGKRNLSKLKDKGWDLIAMRSDDDIGGIMNVRPAEVQPGMALSIYGRNFEGKKLRLKIGDKVITDGREIDAEVDKEVDRAINQGTEINATLLRTLLKTLLGRLLGTSFRVINENLIKVKISPKEERGTKILSLASEGGEGEGGVAAEVTTKFDVLPVEPRLITITEVRPDKGISGDLITVYGINFSEDARVSIADTPVEKVTFVDNTQINIMIPRDMTPATTTLNVTTDQGTASKQFRIL